MVRRAWGPAVVLAVATPAFAAVPKNCLDPECILPVTRLGLTREQTKVLAESQLAPDESFPRARDSFRSNPSDPFLVLRFIKAADWAGKLPEAIEAFRQDKTPEGQTALHYAAGLLAGGVPGEAPRLPRFSSPLWRLIAIGAAASGRHTGWTRYACLASLRDWPDEARLHELLGYAYSGFMDHPLGAAKDIYGPISHDLVSVVRPDLAARHYQMAIWLDPGRSTPYYRLSLALYRMDRAKSEVAMARFLALSGTRFGARQAMARSLFPSLAARL